MDETFPKFYFLPGDVVSLKGAPHVSYTVQSAYTQHGERRYECRSESGSTAQLGHAHVELRKSRNEDLINVGETVVFQRHLIVQDGPIEKYYAEPWIGDVTRVWSDWLGVVQLHVQIPGRPEPFKVAYGQVRRLTHCLK